MNIFFEFIKGNILINEKNESMNFCVKLINNKLFKIILLYLLISIRNINPLNEKIVVEINNKINETLFEKDLDFSNYSTEMKIIAVYYPEFIYINDNYINKDGNEEKNKNFENSNSQKELNININEKFKNSFLYEDIKMNIKLAKNHGIYGFGIIYYWFSGKILYEEVINMFLEKKDINYPFFIIWKNDNLEYNNSNNNIIIEQDYNLDSIINFIKDVKKFFTCDNYITISQKPILAIYETNVIPNLKEFIPNLRITAKEYGIGALYIIGTLNEDKNNNYTNLFDYFYEFPPKNINIEELINNEMYYYSSLIYNIYFKYINNANNNHFYRGIILGLDNTLINKTSFKIKEYSPEKLYIISKFLINWTKSHYNKKNYFIFINAWNNWKEGNYLQPDQKYGYASINSLSKAIFNLPYKKYKSNLSNLQNKCKVAIQAHIFYDDLIFDIINKTNNMPTLFDLYISTTSNETKDIIIEYVKKYSKATKYEIITINNKGRDVLPLLTQLKENIKRYKYICHLHSKKSKTSPDIGISWRNYLFNNLLGNLEIVSEILSDFENIDKLGFLFPETFCEVIKHSLKLTKKNKKYMNYIIKKLFNNYKIGNQLFFPAGNMFWARTKAIYQIFEFNFNRMFDKEKDQVNDTIMHGIERIWLYLVKLNGYYYKTIFKSFN